MTTPTPNLGLLLYNGTTDSTATFLAWRLANDGDGGGSNMSLIDTAIGADRARLTALEALSTIIPVSATYISGSNYTATGITAITSYTNALVIQLKLNLVNPGAITLDINTLGVKPIVKLDTTGAAISLAAGDLAPNRLNLFNYNSAIGSGSWVWINGTSADQVNIVGTAGNVVKVKSDKSLDGSTPPNTFISATIHDNTLTPFKSPFASPGADTDEIAIVDTQSSNILKKITMATLRTFMSSNLGAMILAATAKSPVGGDTIGYADAADSSTKRSTFTTLFSTFGVLLAASTAKTALAAAADLVMVADSTNSNVTRKMTLSDVFSVISNLATKTSVVNADIIPIADSAAGTAFNSAKITIANLVASLKTLIATDTLATPTDITTNNATTTYHGFLKKLPSTIPVDVMRGDGTWGGIYAPEGFLQNGVITPTVSSNNLTVAIKTLSGGNPSATDPVYVRINGVIRSITSALSVTKNAGTNWCNGGSAELATNEVDYFCYLGYNTTDGVTIGFSRVPYGMIYSDFSTTTTNDKYCAISTITNATSSDEYVNIGRFAATLSAAASYNWSVPTFTFANLVNRPIYTTRILTSTSIVTYAGGTTDPTSNTIVFSTYRLHLREFWFALQSTLVRGTGNRTSTRFSYPLLSTTISVVGPTSSMNSITAGGLIQSGTSYFGTASNSVFITQTMANDGSYYINGSVLIP